MSYESTIVKKPWGYEYLAYENEHVALWFLYIKHTHSTSLHCHPKKTTGLTLLDGQAEVSFFNHTNKLNPGNKVMIRKGLFHTTYHRGPVVVSDNIVSSPHYDFMGEWMRTGYEVFEKRGK